MAASTYAGNTILDLLLRGVAFAAPSRVWISLHTADPALTGANEVSLVAWPAYARQDPAAGGAVGDGFDAAASKATDNALEITFPAMDGASPVTVTHFAIWDAATAGNCLLVGALSSSKTYNPTDEAVIHAGALDISVT